jgi:hypothetical protein
VGAPSKRLGFEGEAGDRKRTDRGLGRTVGALLSLAIVITVVVLALQGGGGGDGTRVDTAPRLVDEGDLFSLAADLGHPVYWAGPRPPSQIELTREAAGSVYLRYLPVAAEPGDPRPRFLTVGTYPVAEAQATLRRTAEGAGASLGHVPGGGVVLVDPSEPASVYLAYPASDLQIEVYNPAPGRAMRLIRSGAVQPLGLSR